ncbi:uncharacterized protein GIQ15_05423 [Arthroderma uncinatum]|uniref:uncharacterized protein n=1 Tax=Arthroderma uncinatum TaxID=74035 RepID=UPI00144AB626|nr:uncharacterized protein GIQ15_05423 [Arthroderma uncinatum]KAF3480076.1 hypothetical protein GIQ15_05423 [Arthroderma uncinatum]
MARPSNAWTGFDNLDSESDQYHRILKLLSTANFEYLETRALGFRTKKDKTLSPDVSCSIDTSRFTCGFNNLILEVVFSDQVYWVARIQHGPVDASIQEDMLSEIATMRLVRERTSIPVPEVFDYAVSDTPFGYPYMLVQCLPGKPCDSVIATAAPSKHFQKAASQVADIFFELQQLSFDTIGKVVSSGDARSEFELIPHGPNKDAEPPQTSLDYFYRERVIQNKEIVSVHPDDPDWLTACWVLKMATDHIYTDDRIDGPFPLCHLDLHHGNILFDEEYNLTGVLDWSHAQTVPLERFALCPEFITFPGRSDDDNRPIIEFRDLVIQAIKKREAKERGSQDQDCSKTLLSAFMESPKAEIAYFCHISNSRQALWFAQRARKVMFGEEITWEQLKKVYGTKPLC